MLKENFLLDDFQEAGTSIEAFAERIKEIASKTTFYKCNSRELSVLSYVDMIDTDKGERMQFYEFNPMRVPSEGGSLKLSASKLTINPVNILSKGNFEPLLKEVKDNTGVLFYNGTKALFVSKKVLTQRLQPFGLGGDFLADKSMERDLLIAKRFAKGLNRTLVVREINGLKKVFSVLGEKYRHMPQDILIDIYNELPKDELGDPDCRYWEISHFHSGIRVEFPKKAKELQALYGLPDDFVPGVFLSTSDTGDSSIRVRSVWRTKNSYSLHGEVARRHSGNIDIKDLFEDIEEKIFAEYAKLPEALCDLMSQDITDPSWDLTNTKDRAKNKAKLENVLKTAFKQLKITSAIGKKAEMALFEQVLDEFDDSMAYTAYDIAVSIMSTPERVSGLHSLLQEKLGEAVGRAPYIKYESTKTEPIILTA